MAGRPNIYKPQIRRSPAYIFARGALGALSLLPLWLLYGISNVAAWALRKVLRYRLDIVRENLEACYPDLTDRQRRSIEREFYRHLTDRMVETVKLLHISDAQISRRITVRGGELVERAVDGGHPVHLFLGHYGNWEWVPAIVHGYRRGVPSLQIYKPIHSLIADALMLRIRSRFGSQSVPMASTLRTLLHTLRTQGPYVVGFISDNRTSWRKPPQNTLFLGRETPFVTGAEDIGDKLGAEYLYLDVEQTSRGHYTLTFLPIVPTEQEQQLDHPVTRAYHRMLEYTISRNPSLWLWSHRRWSYPPQPSTIKHNIS